MLCLDRRVDECVYLSGDIRIMVISIDQRYGKVRLGIEAPPEVLIFRDPEILAREELARKEKPRD